MAVIEKFFGAEYSSQGNTNPNSAAAPILENVYQDLVSQTRQSLLLNTSGLSCMLDIKLRINKQTESRNIDLLPTMQYLDTVYENNVALNTLSEKVLKIRYFHSFLTREILSKLSDLDFKV